MKASESEVSSNDQVVSLGNKKMQSLCLPETI